MPQGERTDAIPEGPGAPSSRCIKHGRSLQPHRHTSPWCGVCSSPAREANELYVMLGIGRAPPAVPQIAARIFADGDLTAWLGM
jgi:hypothetical protein